MAVLSILLSYSVIPFGYRLILANLSISIFLWIAVSSLAPVGLLMSGYGSNNKYSFLGGLRAAAQSISYEISLTLCVNKNEWMVSIKRDMGNSFQRHTPPFSRLLRFATLYRQLPRTNFAIFLDFNGVSCILSKILIIVIFSHWDYIFLINALLFVEKRKAVDMDFMVGKI
ncbi:uncharacterized protein LOC111408470 [Olea europaea var. sylvestris]|uniref:uncharacterized protein LOC111408470 n=1 Tax=Olea europaea var. sylvestris TaxID=158386 RepID=UPI000C1D6E65|nr:uncharacterized protein LOC111408470 [Olea europaea var. sylvestris]